jgi:hypothetical protein
MGHSGEKEKVTQDPRNCAEGRNLGAIGDLKTCAQRMTDQEKCTEGGGDTGPRDSKNCARGEGDMEPHENGGTTGP